jgi:hypothetical protein
MLYHKHKRNHLIVGKREVMDINLHKVRRNISGKRRYVIQKHSLTLGFIKNIKLWKKKK